MTPSRHLPIISLRALEPSDIDCLYIWENDPEMWHYGASSAPYSRHQLWEYINNYTADPIRDGQLRLMITHDTAPIGTIDLYNLDPRNRNAYVGIMIAKDFRRQGFALAALTHICEYCKNTLALHQLAAIVSADNTPSCSLFSKAGFIKQGSLTNWIRCSNGSYSNAQLMQISL